MTPKTKFWLMDVPGRDPVVLLWCGGCHWHFLAAFFFLAVTTGDCGDEIPSKSKPQPAGVTSCSNPANLLVSR